MTIAKSALELFAGCLVYSLIVVLIDFVFILFFRRELNQIASSLSFVMLVEGGLGLTVGGAVASFSPTVSKIEESIFHSKPWDAKRQREAEKQARTWILTGIVLVLAGLLISAL
jgi:hypothetical protein